jgi:hypothetical protein
VSDPQGAVPELTPTDLGRDAAEALAWLAAHKEAGIPAAFVADDWVRLAAHYRAALAAERERAESAERWVTHKDKIGGRWFKRCRETEAERDALRQEVAGLRAGLEAEKQGETCPDCGRVKARSVADAATGLCPKWWATRDPDADADCRRARQLLDRPA